MLELAVGFSYSRGWRLEPGPSFFDAARGCCVGEGEVREQTVHRGAFEAQLLRLIVIQNGRIVIEVVVLITDAGMQQQGGREGLVEVQPLHVGEDESADRTR